ncbi:hypothetical protein K504DRAFT_70600 [Pleomassaria siparia CBS 279.74]|uniref:Uncharacterized protein n=1 Tax=Pleomassaria siparia CBS 279.74 TaxID=1314801 RepID=A0A6G1K2R9_9PLEO|nr:hypothetical protein K504DRAFT_70600 [Pleomassaria siparia CBS 279.74]
MHVTRKQRRRSSAAAAKKIRPCARARPPTPKARASDVQRTRPTVCSHYKLFSQSNPINPPRARGDGLVHTWIAICSCTCTYINAPDPTRSSAVQCNSG